MKRLLRPLIFAGLGLLALGLLFFVARFADDWMVGTILARRIAALEAAGEPVWPADLFPAPIAPENNAATYLAQAKNDVAAIELAIQSADPKSPSWPQSGDALTAARSGFDAYPNALVLLEQAAASSDYHPQLMLTSGRTISASLAPHLQYERQIVRVLNSRVQVLLADGEQEEALRTVLLMFRLGRQFDRNPFVVSLLVNIAFREVAVEAANHVLRAGSLSEAARDSLEAELARHEGVESLRRAWRADRACGLQVFRDLAQDDAAELGPSWWWPASFKRDECDYLHVMALEIAEASPPDADSDGHPPIWDVVQHSGPITQQMAPADQAIHDAVSRDQALVRCLRVLNAIQRYEQAGKAGEPGLTDLGLPADAITDPYNGQLLHVKKLADGWLIYSVGWDQSNDDGEKLGPFAGEDVGLGPSEHPENQ